METNTYGGIGVRVGIQAVAKLLSVGHPLMHLQRYGMQENSLRNKGDTIKWRRYLPFTVSKAPLAEGVPPSAIPLQKQDYTAVLQQFGALAYITDKVKNLHEDNIFRVVIQRHGELFAKTMEVLTWDVVTSGTNVFYASGVANRAAVVNAPVRADFRLIDRAFSRNDGQMLTSIIEPTAKVSTKGIEPAFVALAHTDLKADLRSMTGYTPVVEYASPGSRLPGEDGACEGFRFILSRLYAPLAASGGSTADMLANGAKPSGATNCDVYQVVCLARDAYGVVRLQGMEAIGLKVRQPEDLDTGNPLGQKGSVGWLTWWAAAILNEQWLARLECACRHTPAN
jgi:N4-gp56 family major capsid protein